MLVKQDWDINVILLEDEKNLKEYFFYVVVRWEVFDSDERLVRSTWVDTKIVIRNIDSFIMTLRLEVK